MGEMMRKHRNLGENLIFYALNHKPSNLLYLNLR